MKILDDREHRIFLSAMRRERKVCESEDFFDYDGTNKLLDICDSIERKINDAEPVRHGHWGVVNVGTSFYEERKCSCCKQFIKSNYWKRCPNCGAKMDEEDNT